MSEPQVLNQHGRHRRGRPPWVLPLAVVLAALVGFGLGMVIARGDGGILSAASTAAPTVPAVPTTELPTAGARPSGGTGTSGIPAPPDPSNAEAGPVSSYLAALDQSQVPIGLNREVVIAIGRQVCQQPPDRRADPAGLAAHIVAVFPELWNAAQAKAMVVAAEQHMC